MQEVLRLKNGIRVVFFRKSNHLKLLSAEYTDSTLSVLNGKLTDFYPNGQVQQAQFFEMGVPDGLLQKWNRDGHQTDSILFVDGKPMLKKTFSWKNDALINETTTNSLNNSFQNVHYDTLGKILKAFVFKGNLGVERTFKPDGSFTDGDRLFSRK